MRFRLANSVGANQGGQQLAGGIGSLFQGFAMAPFIQAQETEARIAAETKAAQDAERLRTESALRMAQQGAAQANARQSDAASALYGEKVGEIRTQQNRGTLGELIKSAAMTRGIPQAMAPDLDYAINTGGLPQGKYQSPNAQAEFAHFLRAGSAMPGAPVDTTMGPSMPLPDALRPENIAKVMRDLGLMQNSLALGRGTIEDVAKAQDIYRSQDLGDGVLAGNLGAGQVGQAQAAMRGQKLIDNIGDSGAGFNMFTGQGQTLNPGMAAIFGNKANAQIGADNARAGASKASAASSWASAAKTNQDRRMGEKGVLQQTDQGLALVNPRTGTATLVTGSDGKPLTKPGGMNLTEGERKAATLLTRLRGSQEQMLTALGADPSAAKPGYAAEFVRAIPGIGGDTPANLLTPETRQRVEAAQLDMLDAALTLGTGAAYTREQLEGYRRSYFPQIGDGPKQVDDKRVRLANVIRAAEIAAGRAEPLTPRPGGASGSWGDKPPAAALPPRNAKGWALQEDARGNRAYVSPDGRQFEEVR